MEVNLSPGQTVITITMSHAEAKQLVLDTENVAGIGSRSYPALHELIGTLYSMLSNHLNEVQ
jgi:hypothetical protein